MPVHIFEATDSTFCANYTLKSVARDNFSKFNQVTIKTILKSLYSKDLLTSVVDNKKANNIAPKLVTVMEKEGF